MTPILMAAWRAACKADKRAATSGSLASSVAAENAWKAFNKLAGPVNGVEVESRTQRVTGAAAGGEREAIVAWLDRAEKQGVDPL